MALRSKEELAAIVTNYVKNNAEPDKDYCPHLFLRIRRQKKGVTFNLIYDVINHKVYEEDSIPAGVLPKEYSNYYNLGGYNAYDNIQYSSRTPFPKGYGNYDAYYAKYIPELKMIDFGFIKIDASLPSIDRNMTPDGEVVYRINKFEAPRKWEFSQRHFMFRDSVSVFKPTGEEEKEIGSNNIKYTISHKFCGVEEPNVSCYEWRKFLTGRNNHVTSWNGYDGYYHENRKYFLDRQKRELTIGDKTSKAKKEILAKPLSPIEDIAMECKSILVQFKSTKKIYDVVLDKSIDALADESVLINDAGYFYEQVNEKWGVFRYFVRDKYSTELKKIKEESYNGTYHEVATSVNEYFRVYIDNNGNTFKAIYSTFIDRWVGSSSKIEYLGLGYGGKVKFFNFEEAKKNAFISNNWDLISSFNDKDKMKIIMNLKESKKDNCLNQMIEKNLNNIFLMAINSIDCPKYAKKDLKTNFQNWFGRPNTYGEINSIYDSGLNDYQLDWYNMAIDENNEDKTSSDVFNSIKPLTKGKRFNMLSNIEFINMIDFYNKIRSNVRYYYISEFVNPERSHHSNNDILNNRLADIYSCYQKNKLIEDWFDDYNKAVKRARSNYYYKSDVTPIRIIDSDYQTIEGVNRITKELNRWCDEVDSK